MIRVFLVDDEIATRESIRNFFPWEESGYTLVGEAPDGEIALPMIQDSKPDILITDIRMPFMDGLELCRRLKQRLPAAKLVVFSGFDDFEYAKQAIQMNVSEYILKPINAAELSAVLRRLKDQLDRERTERQNMEFFRSQYTESLPVLQELFYTRLLDGRIPPGQEAAQARRLDIDLYSEGGWVAALAHIGSGGLKSTMAPLSIQQLLEENLSHVGCKTFFI